jgi:DNA-binding protein HU-beta
MNKKKLINSISKATDLTKKEINQILILIIETIIDTVSMGEKVRLIGFGSFYSQTKASRVGRNPKTGNLLQIPSSQTIKFCAGKFFKERVNSN